MSIKIILPEHHELVTSETDPNFLVLPAIEIAPTNPANPPQILQVIPLVEGIPNNLATALQSAYKPYHSNLNGLAKKPLKLTTPHRLKQPSCYWNEPLIDVECTLQVEVEYLETDDVGRFQADQIMTTTAICQLWTKASAPTEPKKVPYPGWLSIDFGTSNSTVTLYDPREIDPPFVLPREQEEWLSDRLIAWLDQPSTEPEWTKFLQELSQQLRDSTRPTDTQNLGQRLIRALGLMETVRQIELALSTKKFSQRVKQELQELYHQAFRMPPMEWQRLFQVELDRDRKLSEIPSELEVSHIAPNLPASDPKKVQVTLGEVAKANRLEALSLGKPISGHFFHSPKRYFGREQPFPVTYADETIEIPVNQLLQAAYAHLIQLTDHYRQRGQFAVGDFFRAIVTYPTIASPYVRREMKTLIEQLGIENVQMAYDEAVAVALFFLWREFGGNLNIGLEAFKTRCHRQGDRWWQNVLVLDIGGGTTDLALIRLTLEEINPFEANEDRGDGGRYYKLTPKLLGASGHLQLGGELITLRLFEWLKVAIADQLLSAISMDRIAQDTVLVDLKELDERFRDQDTFRTGSLIDSVTGDNLSDRAAALKIAEKVLPTQRWKDASRRVQTFYTLWDLAEKAKVDLAKGKASIEISEHQISDLLAYQDIQLPSESLDFLGVTLKVEQFEWAATPVIQEAIGIAKGLVENALQRQRADSAMPELEQMDWLILSGKTCQSELVKRELYRAFSESKDFVWNEERVTFEPEYTKIATSAGACYAEDLIQRRFAPKNAIKRLQEGNHQLYIDIKNLFYFLPCSFERKVDSGTETLFSVGQHLRQLEPNSLTAKLRSDWKPILPTNDIYRHDFVGRPIQLWGSYMIDTLSKQLNMTQDEMIQEIKVQFEINQKLDFDLLLCRGMPHYLIDSELLSLNLADVIAIQSPLKISDDSQIASVICDIAVNVAEAASATIPDGEDPLFVVGETYALETFRADNASVQRGLIAPLPKVPENGHHTFYVKFRGQSSEPWKLIGELPVPVVKADYSCQYYVSLTEQGVLRVHAFEIPYWTGTESEALRQVGCVFRTPFQPQPNNSLQPERDPFNGTH